MGMGYYSMMMSTITAMMVLKTAYPIIQFEWIVLASPIPILLTLYIGYFLDKKNINTMDMMKSNEMANRFIMTSDLKAQEFQLLQTKVLLQAMTQLKAGQPVDMNLLDKEYQAYVEKWKSPYT
jgi:hypothetical protein